jgi:hypothetical protein
MMNVVLMRPVSTEFVWILVIVVPELSVSQ